MEKFASTMFLFWLRLLLLLALIATTMPIFSGYTVCLWTLCTAALVFGIRKWVGLRHSDRSTELSLVAVKREQRLKEILQPINVGMLVFILLHVISALLSYAWGDGGSWKEVQRALTHMLLKNAVLWLVLSNGLRWALRYGVSVRDVLPYFVGWMVIYWLYCSFQRNTGINWAQGFDAVLGPNRLAYGFYRVSGLMGHPLTLAFNLCLLNALAILFSTDAFVRKDKRTSWLWTAVGIATASILLISGSRFAVVVALLGVALSDFRSIWRVKYWLLAGGVLLALGLWWEGSLIGRFTELFTGTASLTERFPRLVFWQVHWQMFLDSPWFGSGIAAAERVANTHYDAMQHYGERYGAHQMILQELADSGLLGLLGLLSLWGGIIYSAKRTKMGVGRGLVCLLITAILASLMQNNFRDSEFLYAFWLSLAVVATASARQDIPT